MGLVKEVKRSAISLCVMLFFLMAGVLFLSLYEDTVMISFNWGSNNTTWTTGWQYDYDWVGGLENWSLAVGLACSIAAFISFIVLIFSLKSLIDEYRVFVKDYERGSAKSPEDIKENLLKSSSENKDISSKLDQLILYKAKGIITEEEFEKIKEKLISDNL